MAKSAKRGGLGADALFPTPTPPQPGPADAPRPAPTIEFRKSTFPIRSDQIDELTTVIAQIYLSHRVDLSRAVIVRYGLSLVLSMAKDDPGRLLQQLQAFEQMELAMNENRSHSLSPGLATYGQ